MKPATSYSSLDLIFSPMQNGQMTRKLKHNKYYNNIIKNAAFSKTRHC